MKARIKYVGIMEPSPVRRRWALDLVWKLTPVGELKTQVLAREGEVEPVITWHLTTWNHPANVGSLFEAPRSEWPSAELEAMVEDETDEGPLEIALAVAAWQAAEQAMLAPAVDLAQQWLWASEEARLHLPAPEAQVALIADLKATPGIPLMRGLA